MTKARTLADFISDGSPLADGQISVSEVSGAAPLASPDFTGTLSLAGTDLTPDFTELNHVNGVTSAIQTQIDTKAPSANPTFTGTASGSFSGPLAGNVTGEVTASKLNSTEALPTVRPSLLLDFANSKTLDPRITFTRGSTATYWDGHTTTKAEENLITYSSLSSDVSTSNISITSTTETAPDGSAQGREITSTATTHALVSMSTNVTNGKFYAFSVYLKYVDWQYISLDVQDSRFNGSANIVVDLVNGTITKQNGYSNGSITDVGNGWYRVGFVDLCSFTSTNAFMVYQNDGGTTLDITGVTSGKKWLVWGMQVEQRDAITSYTPTSGTPIVKYQPTLQTAASGEARFDHDPVTGESKGLLIEEARTNVNTDSDAYGSWTSSGVYNFGDNGIAPDGTNKAQFLGIVSTTTGIYRYIDYSGSTGYRTFSIFAKDAGDVGSGYALFRISEETTAAKRYGIIVDLSDGSVTDEVSGNSPANTSYQVDNIGNGWYRITLTLNSGSTSTLRIAIAPYGNSTWSSAAGSVLTPSNAGGTVGTGVLFWGTQVEAGAFATSYIPTSGSTVTRSLDSCTFLDLSQIDYNQGNGTTMLIEAQTPGNSTLRGLMNFSSGSETNFYGITEADGTILGRLRSNGTYEIEQTSATGLSAGEYATTAMSIDFNNVSARTATNGTVSTEDTSFSQTVPANITRLAIGTIASSSYVISGCVKKAALYPKAFNSATLQAMTEE